MTELSPASLRAIRWTVTLAASLGWFFDAYVITIYALTVPLIAAEFHLATSCRLRRAEPSSSTGS